MYKTIFVQIFTKYENQNYGTKANWEYELHTNRKEKGEAPDKYKGGHFYLRGLSTHLTASSITILKYRLRPELKFHIMLFKINNANHYVRMIVEAICHEFEYNAEY